MTYTTNPKNLNDAKKVQEYKVKLVEIVLDLPIIVERLQAINFHDVTFNAPADIKLALAEWFSELVDQINESPEDFIRNHCTKVFDKMLPEPCDSDCYQALSDDDYEVILPNVPSNPVTVSQTHLEGKQVEVHSITASVTYSITQINNHVIQ